VSPLLFFYSLGDVVIVLLIIILSIIKVKVIKVKEYQFRQQKKTKKCACFQARPHFLVFILLFCHRDKRDYISYIP